MWTIVNFINATLTITPSVNSPLVLYIYISYYKWDIIVKGFYYESQYTI
jgi:hypothetical protein